MMERGAGYRKFYIQRRKGYSSMTYSDKWPRSTRWARKACRVQPAISRPTISAQQMRMVTDQNANVVGRHDYLPFGEEIAANTGGRNGTFGTQDFVNQKFSGKERDQETGLDYFGARYYSGALGRFTSPDEPLIDQEAEDPQSGTLQLRQKQSAECNRSDRTLHKWIQRKWNFLL